VVRSIYLLRHPEIKGKGRYIGRTDAELSENGLKQAERIKAYFKDIKLDMVISSPLKRCRGVAEQIALQKDTRLIIEECLAEIDFGLWEALSYNEIEKEYREEWEEYMARPLLFTFPQGDNVVNYINKSAACFERYAGEFTGNILFVSHAGFIKSVISKIWYDDVRQFFNIDCSYASFYQLNGKNAPVYKPYPFY